MSKITDRELRSRVKSHVLGTEEKIRAGDSLFLFITKAGTPVWRYYYRFEGRQKTFSVGAYPEVSLRQARASLHEARLKLSNGIDPSKEKQDKKFKKTRGNTFHYYADQWFEISSSRWTENHAIKVRLSLDKELIPFFSTKEINEIYPQDVIVFYQNFRARLGGIETAEKLLGRLVNIMEHAEMMGARDVKRIDLITKQLIKNNKVPVENRPALREERLAEFFRRYHRYCLERRHSSRRVQIALLLVIITFPRITTLRKATWKEIDSEKKLWFPSAENMKFGREHHFYPLSDWAIELLDELKNHLKDSPSDDDYLFFSNRNKSNCISDNTLRKVLISLGYSTQGNEPATIHGFRGTASTIINNYKPEWRYIVERQLAHTGRTGDDTEKAYNHSTNEKQRVEMMQWYSDFIREKYEEGKILFNKDIAEILNSR
ncbi:MAG: integrase arm-type DNA-binding domain-containing protein [Crenarchaeota archaeon]|nr:integrase arm-type DNA-binding domain-containing protein [Thermoproteota archaeon]